MKKKLLILIAFFAFHPTANAGLVDAMLGGFVSACGSPPTKSCAVDYWMGAANSMSNIAAQYNAFANQPGFHQWCGAYPGECAQFQHDYQEVVYAFGFAVNMLQYWMYV